MFSVVVGNNEGRSRTVIMASFCHSRETGFMSAVWRFRIESGKPVSRVGGA